MSDNINENVMATVTDIKPKKTKRSKAPWIILAVFAGVLAITFAFTVVAGSFLLINYPYGDNSSESGSTPSFNGNEAELYNYIPSSPTYVNPPVELVEKTPDVEMEYADIFAKLCNSVVRILTSEKANGQTYYSATGFFITEDGYIFTNAHVIDDAKKVEILTYDNKLYPVKVVGYDKLNDVALLKAEGNGFCAAELRDSDSLSVGEELAVIGGPKSIELSYTMTHGILSGIRYNFSFGSERVRDLLQTDTPTNQGNSGSPLIDKNGKVVGIISSKLYSLTEVSIEGLAFAVPINVAIDMLDELLTYGRKLQSPAIGIIDSIFVEATPGVPCGMSIGGTIKGSDAEAKGIKGGDILVKFNGVDVTSTDVLLAEIAKVKPYQTVSIVIFSDGSYKNIDVVLGEFIEY